VRASPQNLTTAGFVSLHWIEELADRVCGTTSKVKAIEPDASTLNATAAFSQSSLGLVTLSEPTDLRPPSHPNVNSRWTRAPSLTSD